MAVLDILLYPHPTLRIKCHEVEKIDREILTLLDDMAETMYVSKGVGLAAPQVGSEKRVIVIDASSGEERGSSLMELINPTIVKTWGDKRSSEEGCLSFPQLYDSVTRPTGVHVEAIDRHGKKIVIEDEAFLSIVLQHEIDHLNGVLFIDYLGRLKQSAIIRKMKKRFKNQLSYNPAEQ